MASVSALYCRHQHRQETRRTNGTSFHPHRKNLDLAAPCVQFLGKDEHRSPVNLGNACEHDRKPRHEEGRSVTSPAHGLNVTRSTQVEKLLFILPVEVRWELCIDHADAPQRTGVRGPRAAG